jgi:putative phosphoribosyl transferase
LAAIASGNLVTQALLEDDMQKYFDRHEAGKVLAEQMKPYTKRANTIVLALPRGGVPVAYEIARILQLPLDVFIVRKLGLPSHAEVAFGAIATGGVIVFNETMLQSPELTQSAVDEVIQSEHRELQRREAAYRGHRPFPILNDKTIILVDDGIATGATMRVAIKALREQNPVEIIVAVPVSDLSAYTDIKKMANQVFCPLMPDHFYAVGVWYDHFSQTTDAEVFALLHQSSSFK